MLTREEKTRHLNTFIAWCKIRRENTVTLISALGFPSEDNLDALYSADEDRFNTLMSLIGECCAKELEFLAEQGFLGVYYAGDDEPAQNAPSTETRQ